MSEPTRPAGPAPGASPTPPDRGGGPPTPPGRADVGNAPSRPGGTLIALLALLTAIAALSTDMYLPALPAVAADLGTSASGVQLTLTTFMVGLAAGQFVIGPLSDVAGRRRPLLAGVTLCLAASIACALAPDIITLAVARFVQGFSGAAGVVIARAIISDTTRGRDTAKLMSLMMIIVGVMPVLAPLAGAGVLQVTDWRGVFWAVAALVLVMVVGSVAVVPETLPADRRHPVGLRPLLSNTAAVLRNRRYRFALMTFTLSFGAMFSYISASPFVLQNVAGLTTVQYAVAFGVNGLGMMAAGALSIRLVDRLPVVRVLAVGVSLLLVSALGLLVTVLLGTPAVPVLACLFLLVSSMGLIMGNASATAMGAVTTRAGSGSALLGACQFLLAALVAPLVGLGGDADALPLAVTVLACAVLAMAALLALTRDVATGDPAETSHG